MAKPLVTDASALCFSGLVGETLSSQGVDLQDTVGHWTATGNAPSHTVVPDNG